MLNAELKISTLPSRIFLSPPHMSGMELRFIQDAFDSNYIAPIGPQVDAFEKEFSDLLDRELASCAEKGKLPKAVVPTDLYGQSCDLGRILEICGHYGVPVVCDSAEAMGACEAKVTVVLRCRGRKPLTIQGFRLKPICSKW